MMLILSLAGCGKETAQTGTDSQSTDAKEIQPETITFIRGSGDPQTCVTYVITHGKIDTYRLLVDGYGWFNAEPWMYEESWEQYTLEDDEWKSIVDILNDKGFSALPEDLSAEGVLDGGFSHIEVLTEDERFYSGGRNVDAGNSKDQKRSWAMSAIMMSEKKTCSVRYGSSDSVS